MPKKFVYAESVLAISRWSSVAKTSGDLKIPPGLKTMIRRVVKVGGSLLQRDDFVEKINGWTDHRSPAQNLFLFGGGDVINAVRRLDKIHTLNPKLTHWICVDLLNASFAMAQHWFADWRTIETTQQFGDLAAQQPWLSNVIIRCTSFYHQDQAGDLPMDWRTTTDSIAARLAMLTQANELILLKSCSVDEHLSYHAMANHGIVDLAFPNAAKSIASVKVERLA